MFFGSKVHFNVLGAAIFRKDIGKHLVLDQVRPSKKMRILLHKNEMVSV